MGDSLFSSAREFRLWLYTVGHKTLLLRSVKNASASTRIDLVFKPVERLSLPTTLDGIDLRIIPMSALPPSTHESTNRTAFSLSGGTLDSWIVSETWAWHEDDGEYGDPSYFSVPRTVWDP